MWRYTLKWSYVLSFEILNDDNALVLDTLISGVRKHNKSTLGYERKQPLAFIYSDEDCPQMT